VAARGDLASDEKATIDLFKQAGPSVVYITSLARRGYGWFDATEVPQGAGSGFIWDKEGHVVTNFHVILNADSIRVTLSSRSTLPATFVGGAPDKDIAVLKISVPESKLRPILVGTSKDLQVGQRVFAIGNPFGLDQTLTTGIVSALGRTIDSVTNRKIEGVIQTDAAINPGNSGGPLLDSAGRLIGVNTAIASPTGSSAGIGFAVPVDTVNQVVPQLIQHGRVIRPHLGVVLADDRVAQRLGVEGALVLRVQPGSSAASAGLRGTDRDENGEIILGDVILAVGDEKVGSSDDLIAALEKKKAGDTVPVTILRGEKSMQLEVKLQESR
jgi:S1-C subfamily serine protease